MIIAPNLFLLKVYLMKTIIPKAFIFDVDGTLVDNMAVHNRIWLDFFVGLGVAVDPQTFHHQTAGRTAPEVIRLMLGNHLSDAEVWQYGEQKEGIYRATYQPHSVLGLEQFLAQAQAAGVVMAVASAGGRRNIAFVLDSLNIRPYFQAIVSGEDVQNGKPAPDLFLKAADLLGVRPAECLVFEDAWHGVEAARRAGMAAIVLTTSIDPQTIGPESNIMTAVPHFAALSIADLCPQELSASQ